MRVRTMLLFLFAVGVARGQITVEMILEQDQFLRDESVPVGVRIVNRSGQALELGQTPDWLTFTVEAEHVPVRQNSFLDLSGPFKLESSAAGTKHTDLIPSFNLSRPGRYTVRALVQVPGWEKPFLSEPKLFDIGRGVEIWAQEFGVPGAEGAPVEVRRYALIQAQYRPRPTLYARVTDRTDTVVHGVVALGPLVSFSRPEKLLDRQSRLHVIFQTGAQSYSYCAVDPEAHWVARQTYSHFRTRPNLHNEEGEVRVVGGLRRLSPDDYPTAQEQPTLTDVQSSSP